MLHNSEVRFEEHHSVWHDNTETDAQPFMGCLRSAAGFWAPLGFIPGTLSLVHNLLMLPCIHVCVFAFLMIWKSQKDRNNLSATPAQWNKTRIIVEERFMSVCLSEGLWPQCTRKCENALHIIWQTLWGLKHLWRSCLSSHSQSQICIQYDSNEVQLDSKDLLGFSATIMQIEQI